jgi:hypothetical protein
MDVLAESTGGPGSAQIVFLLGLGLVIVVLLVRSKRYFRQVTQYQVPVAPPHRKLGRATASSAPPHSAEKWEVAMHDLARELSGQLDSKIRVLELLIREADEAAARLEAAVRGEGRGARGEESEKDVARGKKPGAASRGTRAALEAPRSPRRINPTAKAEIDAKKPLKIADNPRFERVYALADAGMSVATIANQIGSQVGEVELILSLRGTRPG